jgi:pilus assembly protein FimV
LQVVGLSVGDIKVLSKLGQPLNAEISLPNVSPAEAETLAIEVADRSVFEKAGIEYQQILSRLIFNVRFRANGTPYIHVRTREAVNDLAISFLVKVTWDTGKLVRQYDVLLEPSGMQSSMRHTRDGVVELAKAAAPGDAQQAGESAPAMDTRPAANTRMVSNDYFGPDGRIVYGPVRRGETLSEIAYAIRPDRRMSLPQVITALYRENKNAFLNHNINYLQAGSMLTLSNPDNITVISRAKAMHFVNAQEEIWRNPNAGSMDVNEVFEERQMAAAPAMPDTMAQSDTSGAIVRDNATIASLPPEDMTELVGDADLELDMQPVEGKGLRELKAELIAARRAANALRKHNEKLRARLEMIQTKVAKMQTNLGLADAGKPDDQFQTEQDDKFVLVLGANDDLNQIDRSALPADADTFLSGDQAPVFINKEVQVADASTAQPKASSILAAPPVSMPRGPRSAPTFIDAPATSGDNMLTTIGAVSVGSLILVGFVMRNRKQELMAMINGLRDRITGKNKNMWID